MADAYVSSHRPGTYDNLPAPVYKAQATPVLLTQWPRLENPTLYWTWRQRFYVFFVQGFINFVLIYYFNYFIAEKCFYGWEKKNDDFSVGFELWEVPFSIGTNTWMITFIQTTICYLLAGWIPYIDMFRGVIAPLDKFALEWWWPKEGSDFQKLFRLHTLYFIESELEKNFSVQMGDRFKMSAKRLLWWLVLGFCIWPIFMGIIYGVYGEAEKGDHYNHYPRIELLCAFYGMILAVVMLPIMVITAMRTVGTRFEETEPGTVSTF